MGWRSTEGLGRKRSWRRWKLERRRAEEKYGQMQTGLSLLSWWDSTQAPPPTVASPVTLTAWVTMASRCVVTSLPATGVPSPQMVVLVRYPSRTGPKEQLHCSPQPKYVYAVFSTHSVFISTRELLHGNLMLNVVKAYIESVLQIPTARFQG